MRGRLATLGVLFVVVMTTINCTCPLLSLVARSPTVTPTPTKTPRPSATATWTATFTPETEPSPTATLVTPDTPTPVDTPTLAHTQVPPTPTRRPATATPTRLPPTATPQPPTATPTISYEYSLHSSIEYLPDCSMTSLDGTVWDVESTIQVPGVLLKVCVEGEYWCATLRTGQDPNKGSGYYIAMLGYEGPRDGIWWVAVVDEQGKALSERVSFQTDTRDCDPNGNGRQWVIIDFKRNY